MKRPLADPRDVCLWLPQVLLESLLNLQPRSEGGGGGASGAPRREDVVMAIATDLLEQVPQPFNLEEVMKAKADDPSALHVVLFQVRLQAGAERRGDAQPVPWA